jgi:hypothetical protein
VTTCSRCGYAHGVQKVMLMVDGKATAGQTMCRECLLGVLDAMASRKPALERVRS